MLRALLGKGWFTCLGMWAPKREAVWLLKQSEQLCVEGPMEVASLSDRPSTGHGSEGV